MWREVLKAVAILVDFSILSVLSIFISCILQLCCLVCTHLRCCVFLVDWLFHHYLISLSDLDNFFALKFTVSDVNVFFLSFLVNILMVCLFSIFFLSTFLHTVRIFKICSTNLCLLLNISRQFTFNAITNRLELISLFYFLFSVSFVLCFSALFFLPFCGLLECISPF